MSLSENDSGQTGPFERHFVSLVPHEIPKIVEFDQLYVSIGEADVDRAGHPLSDRPISWGLGSGAYIVLPFLGPSTARDGAARVVDWQGDIVSNLDHVPTRNTLYATRVVSDRSNLFDATSILDEAALDRYTFVRDSWLQRRRSLVYDGSPPREASPDSDEPK